MYTHDFLPGPFLHQIRASPAFALYCQSRGIDFEPNPANPNLEGWSAATQQLPRERQQQVERELVQVNEMAHGDACRLLLDAVDGKNLPPDAVASGAPLALWFLVHQPDLFQELFFRHEIRATDTWRHAQGPPGVQVQNLSAAAVALEETLKTFFRVSEGTGRFCTVDGFRLEKSCCFVAYVADRLKLLEAFTDSGEHTVQRLRPAYPVLFLYYPHDGTILLRSRLRSRHRIVQLLQRFGAAVLGAELGDDCLRTVFNLDVLKTEFNPLPDSEDIEAIRIKSLHLRYPERDGRRQVKLETRTGDDPSAIPCLLRTHLGKEGTLDRLRVCHAELQVLLRVDGRPKSCVIRLWPNRSSLGQTPLADRLRQYLRKWGIAHAPPP